MSLKTIPERLLYELLPSEIINLDERGILHAVVGGIQDHVEDIKSYAKKFEVFFDPTQAPPEGDYNVVVASFYGDQRQVVTRSVIIDETTPEADDQDALDTWTIAALGIEADTFISAEYGYDELRAVDVDILELLASTIGAVIYKTDAVTTVGQRRQAVESYFPRLKVKGTAQSYDVLGRLVGFNHVGYTPLWARVSPRKPDDIGHPDNDPDFSSQPHFTPQAQVSVTYDPNDLRDGAFFTWESGSLTVDASSEDYYTSVTGRNPFISVVPSGTLVGHPDAGVYPLAGGAPHKKASVSPSGAGLTFEAIAEGDANNGLKVTIMEAGTLRKLRITDRLSSIKYRSSYFNLGLFRDLDTLGDESFSAVQSNPDLEDYPTLATSGTAEAPYYPWTTGSIQAPPDALQLDTSGLAELQTQAVPYFEEVRAATRFPRRVSVGYSSTDQVGYAAYQNRTDLFVTSPVDSYAGTVSDSPVYLYSARIGVEVELTDIASRTSPISTFLTATLAHAPERNKITLWNGATQVGEDDGLGRISDTLVTGTVIDGEVDYLTGELRVRVNGSLLQLEVRYSALIELSGETDNSNPNIINFNGTGLAGYYNLSTFEFNFTEVDGGLDDGKFVSALWQTTSTETFRAEPTDVQKDTQRISYQERPEDAIWLKLGEEGSGIFDKQLHDDYPWRRPLTSQGEEVHPDYYESTSSDEVVTEVAQEMGIINQRGVEHRIVGLDDFKAEPDTTIRVKFSPKTADDAPGQNALAASLDLLVDEDGAYVVDEDGFYLGDVSGIYHVGLFGDEDGGVIVADPVSWNHPTHSKGLVGWFPLNEHPEADLRMQDVSSTRSQIDANSLDPESRVWDVLNGWVLLVDDSIDAGTSSSRPVSSQFTISVDVQSFAAGTSSVDSTFLKVGPISWDISPDAATVSVYLRDKAGVRQFVDSYGIASGGWAQIYARVSGNTIISGGTGISEVSVDVEIDEWDNVIQIGPTNGPSLLLSNLRVWNIFKSSTDMLRLEAYPRTTTSVPYKPTYFRTAGKQEKFGLEVMANGFCYPLDIEVSGQAMRRVMRYDETGRYIANPKFKEVGLGGGQLYPDQWHLGNRFYPLVAQGQLVVSSQHTNMPGVNALWEIVSNGATADTTVITADTTYTTADAGSASSPNPYPMPHTNPARDRIWLEGYNQHVFEVWLDDEGDGPTLKADTIRRSRVPEGDGYLSILDLVSGAEVQQTYNGTLLAVDPVTLAVEQSTVVLPYDRPPVYLYNMTQLVSSQSGTEGWTNPTVEGQIAGYPFRNDIGKFSFLSEGSLLAGPHRLDVTSSLEGFPGNDFPGFDVEVTVGRDVFPITLLEGAATETGTRKTESFEFDVATAVIGKWVTTFDWTNDLDNAPQGINRDLAIHGFEIRRIEPRLFEILKDDIILETPTSYAGEGTIPPGGWLAAIGNSGTINEWTHESDQSTRPSDDTLATRVPISDLLTSTTEDRMEDVFMVSYAGSLTEPEPASLVSPSAAVGYEVAESPDISWMLAGAVTDTTVEIRAKVSADGVYRAYLSTSPSLSNMIVSGVDVVDSSNGRVASFTVTGLTKSTVYYYSVGGIAGPDRTKIGKFQTVTYEAMSFTFAAASCASSGSNHAVFDTIRGHNPLFFLHLGDFHYDNIAVNDPALFRASWNTALEASRQQALYLNGQLVYIWDDHDFGPNNSSSTSPGKPAAQQVYREIFPAYHHPVSDAIYYAFTVGRVYFIVTDLRSEKGAAGTTVLGTSQKAWFKQQLLDANGRYPLIVWVNTTPWIGNNGTDPADREASPYGLDDGWGNYPVERREIADFIKDNSIKGLVLVSGDMHSLAFDDGTNSNYTTESDYGVPVFQCAPIDQNSSQKGGPYLDGPYPSSGSAVTRQFGLFNITDTGGDEITISFTGRDSDDEIILSATVSSADSPKVA